MVTNNVGALDSGIRAMLGVAFLVLAASFTDRPLLALGAGFVAIVFMATALLRMCPLYTVLRINTCPRRAQPHGR
jgi:NhaP-type Na+/H+ or K+/H+ antiporter